MMNYLPPGQSLQHSTFSQLESTDKLYFLVCLLCCTVHFAEPREVRLCLLSSTCSFLLSHNKSSRSTLLSSNRSGSSQRDRRRYRWPHRKTLRDAIKSLGKDTRKSRRRDMHRCRKIPKFIARLTRVRLRGHTSCCQDLLFSNWSSSDVRTSCFQDPLCSDFSPSGVQTSCFQDLLFSICCFWVITTKF